MFGLRNHIIPKPTKPDSFGLPLPEVEKKNKMSAAFTSTVGAPESPRPVALPEAKPVIATLGEIPTLPPSTLTPEKQRDALLEGLQGADNPLPTFDNRYDEMKWRGGVDYGGRGGDPMARAEWEHMTRGGKMDPTKPTGKDALRYLRSKSAPLFSAVIDQAIPYQKNKFSAPVARSEELKNRPTSLVKAGLETLSPEAYQWLDQHTRWGYGTDFLNRPVTALNSVTQRLTPIYWNTMYDVLRKEGLTVGEKAARVVPEFFGKATSDFTPTFQRLEIWSGDLNAEMHKHQLKPSVSQLEGESREQYRDRAARAQQMMNEYGEKLLRHNLFQQAKPEQQAAMLRLLEDRITDVSDGQANKKRPDLGKLAPSALQASIAQGEYQKKREAARRQQENVSLPTR